jgi:PAS domain-containing protein
MSDARSPAGDAGTLEVFAELAFGRFGQGDYFREVLDALPAAIYATDAAGQITYFNEAAVKLWGCRPELDNSEWCGSWKLFWPDERGHAARPMSDGNGNKGAASG